jgi:hypothetical protein
MSGTETFDYGGPDGALIMVDVETDGYVLACSPTRKPQVRS